MEIKEYLTTALLRAVQKCFPDIDISTDDIVIEQPRNPSHGDLASPVAMMLAKKLRRRPDEIAREVMQEFEWDSTMIEPDPELNRTIVSGFINISLSTAFLHSMLLHIVRDPATFGKDIVKNPSKILVEFVSANPTGPMVVVNARAAAIGDAISRIYSYIGHDVTREYYVNDYGSQINLLGKSIAYVILSERGITYPRPENGYAGEYIHSLAHRIRSEHPDIDTLDPSEVEQLCAREGLEKNLAGQKRTLEKYGVNYENWFHEHTLHEDGYPGRVLDMLKHKGLVYHADSAVWFRAIEFGDEKDRVLIRSDGSPTYFLADLAYHHYKAQRGFNECITFWGPDHHGYLPRLEAAVRALIPEKTSFYNFIIQQVSLIRDGKPFRMSKRKGDFITIEDLVSEVGVDAARYFFLRRKLSSHFDFDLDLACKRSEENPVYYVQYAHARTCNVLRHAESYGHSAGDTRKANPAILDKPEESQILKSMTRYPDVLYKSATQVEPHRLTSFIEDLAAQYHQFYQKHRIVTEDIALTRSRLLLTTGVRNLLQNALDLLGVGAPQKM